MLNQLYIRTFYLFLLNICVMFLVVLVIGQFENMGFVLSIFILAVIVLLRIYTLRRA